MVGETTKTINYGPEVTEKRIGSSIEPWGTPHTNGANMH